MAECLWWRIPPVEGRIFGNELVVSHERALIGVYDGKAV